MLIFKQLNSIITLRKLIVILVCIALYTPATVSIALFTQCEIKAIIASQEDCGCELNNLPHPNEPFSNSQQQENLKLKSDWKFVVESKFFFQSLENLSNNKNFFCTNSTDYTSDFFRKIFHPPAC